MAPYQNEDLKARTFAPGDTVLLEQLKNQSKASKMDAHSFGPWRVTGVATDGGAACLENPYTKAALLNQTTGLPDRVSTARLTRVRLPDDEGAAEHDVERIKKGDLVAFLKSTSAKLLRVESAEHLASLRGKVYEVPRGQKGGAIARWPWKEVQGRDAVTVPWGDLLCRVTSTSTDTLEPRSLERVLERMQGIAVPE